MPPGSAPTSATTVMTNACTVASPVADCAVEYRPSPMMCSA